MSNRYPGKSKMYLLPTSKTRQQMSDEFDWRSLKTFKLKLEQNGIVLPSGSITPKWQKMIYEELGYPSGTKRSEYEDV